MSHEVVRTRTGTLAMRSISDGEVMHPGVGPLAEAAALYVAQSRLALRLTPHPAALVLFDVGLGAGSNALAARAVSEAAPADAARLHLVSFERDLGALELALASPDAAAFGLAAGCEPASAARALLDDGEHHTARTHWQLVHGDILAALDTMSSTPGGSRADIVYWDPFSPRTNPTLWTVAAFASLLGAAGPRCTLFTYSASTATRIALLLAGWAVGVGDPTGDKRETTAAARDPADLSRPLDRQWLTRVARADAPLPPDAPPDTAARVAACPQFA